MTMELIKTAIYEEKIRDITSGWPYTEVGSAHYEIELHLDLDKIIKEYSYRAVHNKVKVSRILNGAAVLVYKGEVQPPSGTAETGDSTK